MDTRQGNIYETEEDALKAGVPKEFVAKVEAINEEILRIVNGPFKGREYKRTSTGIIRVDNKSEKG